MSHPRIGRTASPLVVETARTRQTPRSSNTFKKILEGSASVLLSGARAATRVVGLPVLSAAVAGAAPETSGPARSLAGVGNGSLEATRALGKQGLDEDLQLLALQREIQRHSRQVALVSNVMKARHDTAKAAITNMRS